MKNITSVLSEEHQHILKVIDLMLKECDQLEKGKETDNEFFNEVIRFIKKYADEYHHAKEEDILFKTMLERMENMHCNPIPVMLNEHDAGRHYVNGMIEAISRNNKKELIENARGYGYLLQNHIYKEDNVLYPMAEDALDENQKERVEHAYSTVELTDFPSTDIRGYIERLGQRN